MAPEVPQIHPHMDRPPHQREAVADAHARAHVASLATALRSGKGGGHAHSDVAVKKGIEGAQALTMRSPVVVPPSDLIIPVM